MKKLILIALALVSFLRAAEPAPAPLPNRTLLSIATKAGNTISTYVGRVQGDPADDGSLTLTIFPLIVKTDSEGTELSRELSTSAAFTLTLTPEQFSGLSAAVKAAYAADQAAKATPPAP